MRKPKPRPHTPPGSDPNGGPSEGAPKAARSHYVPRVVFRTAFAGVVPVCVASACGGSGSPGSTMSGSGSDRSSSHSTTLLGVAASSFAHSSTEWSSVATSSFTNVSTSWLGVAATSFTVTHSQTTSADGSAPDATTGDAAPDHESSDGSHSG